MDLGWSAGRCRWTWSLELDEAGLRTEREYPEPGPGAEGRRAASEADRQSDQRKSKMEKVRRHHIVMFRSSRFASRVDNGIVRRAPVAVRQ